MIIRSNMLIKTIKIDVSIKKNGLFLCDKLKTVVYIVLGIVVA